MIIVCTRDSTIIDVSKRYAADWGGIHVLNHNGNQRSATAELKQVLSKVPHNQDICFSAHGNDLEIGGAGGHLDNWGWDSGAIADLLGTIRTRTGWGWQGRVLFHVCSDSVANFSANVAAALHNISRDGIYCYGYNRKVGIHEGIPSPRTLPSNVSLQLTISGRR